MRSAQRRSVRTEGDPTGAPRQPAAPRSGGRRAVTTIVDQSFSSVSNFAVGVAVARVAGADGLGGFSLAYAGWQVLAALHRSLVTDPMAIEGDVYDPDGSLRSRAVRRGIRRGFAAEILLGLAGAVIFALAGAVLLSFGQRTFGIAMLSMAPWLPVLLVQDYWRWIGFMTRRPRCALANDTVFNCVQAAAFVVVLVTHTHSIAALIGCWGLGGAAGAIYGLRQYGVGPSFTGGIKMLRAHWHVSKWLAGTSLSGSGGVQASVFIVGVILGPVGLGGLRAAQTLVVGPSGVLIMAGGSIGLPEATKGFAEHGWSGLTRVTRLVTAAGFVSFFAGAAVIAFFGKTLLSTIYGPSFGHLELAALLMAVAYIALAFNLGPILILKATRNTRWLFHLQLIDLVVALTAVTVLSINYGVSGAAGASIVMYGVSAMGARWVQHRVRSSGSLAATPSEPPGPELPVLELPGLDLPVLQLPVLPPPGPEPTVTGPAVTEPAVTGPTVTEPTTIGSLAIEASAIESSVVSLSGSSSLLLSEHPGTPAPPPLGAASLGAAVGQSPIRDRQSPTRDVSA
jgi:O-antigen/teichoic acid export membrane protein